MSTYFELKSDMRDLKMEQETQNRVNEIRIKVLEGQVAVLQHDVDNIKNK